METSSYTIDSMIPKLIPGNLLGIIFSDQFEKFYKDIADKPFDKEMSTLVRIKLLEIDPDDNPFLSDGRMDKGYIYYNNGAVINFTENAEEIIGGSSVTYPVFYYDCIKRTGNNHAKIFMAIITKMLFKKLWNFQDGYWNDNDFIDEMLSDREYYDDAQIEAGLEYRKQVDYITKLFQRISDYDLNEYVDKLSKSKKHKPVYDLYLEFKKYIHNIIDSDFTPYLFQYLDEEGENGLGDVNELFFRMVTTKNGYEQDEIEYLFENAGNNGYSNCFLYSYMDDKNYSMLRKEDVLKSINDFENVRTFYEKIREII